MQMQVIVAINNDVTLVYTNLPEASNVAVGRVNENEEKSNTSVGISSQNKSGKKCSRGLFVGHKV